MRPVLATFWLGVVCGFAFPLTFSGCAGPCSSKNCGGCCDAQGICQPGVTVQACGEAGNTCGRCGSTTSCVRGQCEAGGTGGGSATGGGTASGGGSAAGGGSATGGGSACRTVSSFPTDSVLIADYWAFTQSVGHYNLVRFITPRAGFVDGLAIEVVYPNDVGPTPPVTRSIGSATYRSCDVCSVFYEGCDATGDCQKAYLARSGSVTVSRADRNPDLGRIAGSASNLHFVEWNLKTDVASGTGCVDVQALPSFSVGWNHDGGMPPP